MRSYEIDALRTETRIVETIIKDTFEFRKDLRFHWLQKLAIKILRKIGCYSKLREPVISRHVIRPDDIMQNLFEQDIELMELYDSRGKTLLIGVDKYRELTGNPDIRQSISINVEYHKGNKTVHGMTIKVIPWMKGMLVVPSDILKNSAS